MPHSKNIQKQLTEKQPWIGRFAPSPTGELHLGSLVAAVASYMIAKRQGGQWLVRIEDLDPPREIKGAAKSILTSLEDFGLCWDGSVTYQSQRNAIYKQRLEELFSLKFVYQCDCSRRMIEERNHGVYDGFCRSRSLIQNAEQATRIKFSSGFEKFDDHILGKCQFDSEADKQDFIVKRRDGLFAYQLAVVADDIEQNINHVVRGQDILDSTPRQNFLYHCFGLTAPEYFHVPLVKDNSGVKFSKRSAAEPVKKNQATTLLLKALTHLGQSVEREMLDAKPIEIIRYYEEHWQLEKLIGRVSIESH